MKRLLSFFMVVSLIFILVNPFCSDSYTEAATYSGTVINSCNFRSGPGTSYGKIDIGGTTMLPYGQAVTIVDRAYDSDGDLWYKVNVTYNGNSFTGYAFAEYIQRNVADAPATDAAFEEYMNSQGFPESYKPYLRAMHADHPNWKFVAVKTNIDWSTVTSKEYSRSDSKKNTVQFDGSNYNWLSTYVNYNITENSWTPYDGSSWFLAADDVVDYYLDPRTYLDEIHVFAFESLSYIDGVHTIDGVKSILNGTFMQGDNVAFNDPQNRTFAQLIMSAGQSVGVSPYHLASRMRQEMGNTAGSAADGSFKINGVSYYNYFNIGAYDGTNALLQGMKYAANVDSNGVPQPNGSYGRPWDSVEKSIVGGAQFLKGGYIGVGQDTLYTQKFNVTNTGNLFGHQYCTNVQMPFSESASSYRAYVKIGAIDSALVFKIPVYNNMPVAAVKKPSKTGNPNNYLKSLSVEGYNLTPGFSVGYTTDYSLTVPESVASVSISATTAHANAWIQGTGTVNLAVGTNVVYVDVTAQSGRVRRYKLTIVRGAPSDNSNVIEPNPSTHKGDLNGDGQITVIDIIKVQRIIVGLDALTDSNLILADLNGDGKVSAVDIVIIQRHIVGLQSIVW